MGFIETSYGGKPNLSDVNIDSALNMGSYGISSSGSIDISGISSENAGEVDLNNCDLVGVKRFVCEDYLGALLSNYSDNLQQIMIIPDILGGSSKKIRVPSNFISGSTMKMSFNALKNTSNPNGYMQIYKVSINGTTTQIKNLAVSSTTEQTYTETISIKGGDLLYFASQGVTLKGSSGIQFLYDYTVKNGAVWDIVD